MADVFVSYKRENLDAVQRLVLGLRGGGLSVWWDQDIAPDAPWEATIERELETSKVVVVCWSLAGVAVETGENVKAEARRALKRGILLQVYIEPCEPPLFFGERQGIDLALWDGSPSDNRFQSLITAAKAILAGGRPPEGSGYIPVGTSSRAWLRIKDSLDARDYDDFLSVFPSSPEAFDARRQKRQLEDWERASHEGTDAIRQFLNEPLFDSLRRAAEDKLNAAADAHTRREESRKRIQEEKQAGKEIQAQKLAALQTASEQGNAAAQLELGKHHLKNNKAEDAIRWLTKAAEYGQSEAQYLLAKALLSSEGSEALIRIELEAIRDKGDNVANVHKRPKASGRNRKVALAWLRKAANGGAAQAQHALGVELKRSNTVEAAHWLRSSARAGYSLAQRELRGFEREHGSLLKRWRILPVAALIDLPFAAYLTALGLSLLSWTSAFDATAALGALSWQVGPVAVTIGEVLFATLFAMITYVTAAVFYYKNGGHFALGDVLLELFGPVAACATAFALTYLIGIALPQSLTIWTIPFIVVTAALAAIVSVARAGEFPPEANTQRAIAVRTATFAGAMLLSLGMLTL